MDPFKNRPTDQNALQNQNTSFSHRGDLKPDPLAAVRADIKAGKVKPAPKATVTPIGAPIGTQALTFHQRLERLEALVKAPLTSAEKSIQGVYLHG
jgi:hypothetical protein